MSTRKSALVSTYSTLTFRKLNHDSTLKRSFLDFFNSYLIPREKLQTNYEKPQKNGISISNALFINIKTNKI